MSKNGGGKFLLGALIGVGIGMLLAPKSGKELRKDLKVKIDELIEKVKEMDILPEFNNSIEKQLKKIEKDIEMLEKETILKLAKEKVVEIENKLTDIAVKLEELDNDEVKFIFEDIKRKAGKVTKNTIKKLENAE